MDITNKLTNNTTTWDLDLMAMEEHLLHSQVPFPPSFWPYFPTPADQNTPNHAPTPSQFGDPVANPTEGGEEESDREELGAVKEMMYRIASMQPVDIDPATIRKPKRKNVRISDDPQSVAARLRRERISEKIRILQRLVPGGTKLDTASMLDEAIRYVKFLKKQIRLLQSNHQPQCVNVAIGSSSLMPIDWSLRAHGGATTNEPGFGSNAGGGRNMGYLKHEVINDED